MNIAFRALRAGCLRDLSAEAPAGSVIGVAGERGSGQHDLLDVVTGRLALEEGSIESKGRARWFGPLDELDLSECERAGLLYTLDPLDAFSRAKQIRQIQEACRRGATVFLASENHDLLKTLADEVWWLSEGRLAGRGDPSEILLRYRDHLAARLRAWGEEVPAALAPIFRRGDGRAEVERIELLGEQGEPSTVWRSGENVRVRLHVRFHSPVDNPVFGILIRTRIGFEVYGTNTWLEQINTGGFLPGARAIIEYRFRCDLCPQEYTLTAASHDADGALHDWVESAVGFTVTDTRATAGVAKLEAQVTVERD